MQQTIITIPPRSANYCYGKMSCGKNKERENKESNILSRNLYMALSNLEEYLQDTLNQLCFERDQKII